MQAYQISQGKWSAIDDPLNGKPLEDAGFDRYALKSLKLTYLDSPVTIAPRLPPKSYPLSVSKYKFCCLLKVATLEYRIWIADLPDLIQFLQTLTENTSKHLSTIKDDLETMSKQIDQRFNTIEQRLSQLQTKPSDTPT